MENKIIKGNKGYLNDCVVALSNSELGKQYFSSKGSAKAALEEGFNKNEIYVVLDANHNCTGFMWIIMNGMFHSFPYLHIIAVKEAYRNQGIGRELLKYFEEVCYRDKNKVFLVVADFNPKAKRLYESLGYVEVGAIPSLYRDGIKEFLMMKTKG